MKKTNSIVTTGLLCCLFIACGGDRENDDIPVTVNNLRVALQESINKVIMPSVLGFSDSASQLQALSLEFCDAKSLNSLAQAQQAWKQLSNRWFRLAVYNFGPLNDDLVFPKYIFIDSLRLRGTDYLETVRSEVSNNINNEVDINQAFFDSLTFQKTGLLLLEVLLFETSTEQSSEPNDILAEFQFSSRKCELLIEASASLKRTASYIQQGWQVEHLASGQSFQTIILNDQLKDDFDPLALILVSIQNHLDYLQKRNVVSVNAKLAGIAWENIAASIDEVELLLRGVEDSTTSYLQLMTIAGFENSVNLVNENIERIRQAITGKQSDLLASELGRLDGNFKREIPDALAVELGINFTDGD